MIKIIPDFSSETMEDNRPWKNIIKERKITYLRFYNPQEQLSKLWQNKGMFK